MSHSRTTRSSSRLPPTIGENFRSLIRQPSPVPGSSGEVPTRASLTPSNFVHVNPTDDEEGNPGENFLPTDRGIPDPDPDPDPDPNPEPELDPDQEPDEPAPQPEISLARSLELLANKIASIPEAPKPRSTIKPRSPDIFDGSDPTKLDVFTFQCSMYMAARPTDFPNQQSRVAFSLSYLKGVPLDWFQGELSRSLTSGGEFPEWFTSYPTFIAELQRLFGPRDPVADATNALETLRYKDATKAARYTIDFNRHAHRTGWNNVALARQYYKGLPDRLKDEIARIGKPAELRSLQELVATLDQRHWERQSEISRDKRSTSNANPSTSQNKSSSSENRSDKPSSHQGNNGSKPNPSGHTKGKDQKKPAPAANANASNSGNKANSISDLLGPDGKLKPEERQRRMDNSLCLRCGKAGHIVPNCPVPSKAKPKGRAATVSAPQSSADPATASGTGKG
jgi:hypothetical protein